MHDSRLMMSQKRTVWSLEPVTMSVPYSLTATLVTAFSHCDQCTYMSADSIITNRVVARKHAQFAASACIVQPHRAIIPA